MCLKYRIPGGGRPRVGVAAWQCGLGAGESEVAGTWAGTFSDGANAAAARALPVGAMIQRTARTVLRAYGRMYRYVASPVQRRGRDGGSSYCDTRSYLMSGSITVHPFEIEFAFDAEYYEY